MPCRKWARSGRSHYMAAATACWSKMPFSAIRSAIARRACASSPKAGCASYFRPPTRGRRITGCPHRPVTPSTSSCGYISPPPSIWKGVSFILPSYVFPKETMNMSRQLEGRVAIVTGAGAGLGRSHALELANLGASVVVNDRGVEAQQVAQKIGSAGGRAIAYQGDVTRYEDMQALVSRCADAFGRVDILINNAGILRDRSFAKMSLTEFREVIDV